MPEITGAPPRRLAVFVGLTLVLAAVVATPAGRAQTQDRVTLGPTPVGTFEFRVLGPDNQPIVDLRPEEVTLKVNGRAREIRSLQLYRSDPSPGGQAGAARDAEHAPQPADPFASNYPSGAGREVLIVVDDDSIGAGRERSLKPAIANLLSMLNANDRVGVLGIPAGNLNFAPTRQHDRIEAAITSLVGRGTRTEDTSDRYCRALITLNTLQGVFERYAGGSPATIVFFSGGMVAPKTVFTPAVGQPNETCELRAKNFQDVGMVAQKLPIDVHVAYVPEDAVGGTAASNEMLAGLENLAAVTGNPLVRLAGESDRVMTQLVDETSAYYAVTFDIDPAERKASAYRVEVKATRDGAKTRARQYVTFERDGAGKSGPSLKDLIKVAASSRELPMRAAAFAARDAGNDQLKVVTLVEPRDAATVFKELTVALFEPTGKLVAQWTGDAASLARRPVTAAVLVKPGKYRMRAAGIDPDGRRGTVDQQVEASLTPAGSASLSALLLGSRTVDGFVPRLLYGRGDAMAAGYVEVYNVPPGVAIGSKIELAAYADGPALATGTMGMASATQGDMRILMGTVPISALPPGDYVVRISVSVAEQAIGRVTHTLRKSTQ